jgi:glycerol kinase
MGLGVVADDSTGLVSTIAWGDPGLAIAFEGNILSTGATIVWLAGLLETTPAALMALAETAPADHGIDLVPAFAGLGAPWWDETATALISGLGLGTDRAALARAAAESIALQIEDVLAAADRALGTRIDTILADGGPSANDWLIQLQADVSQRRVLRTDTAELSALGAAHLAGQAAGVWTSAEVLDLPRPTTEFLPQRDAAAATARRERWLSAVARSRHLPTTESVPAL